MTTFIYNNSTFQANWLNEEKTALSVTTDDMVFDDHGIDQTDWPSDETVSAHVGKPVGFSDAGDNGEAIFESI